MSALIRFTQGANTAAAGVALVGALTTTVVASNGDNSGIVRWTYQLVDVPPGSAVSKAVQSGATATFSFAPDVRGSYRLMLITERSNGAIDVDIRVFSVPLANGRIVPPYQGNPRPRPLAGAGAKPDEMNFGGQERGYAGSPEHRMLDALLREVDAADVTSPFPPLPIIEVNKDTGSDTASGAPGSPVRTVDEALRRADQAPGFEIVIRIMSSGSHPVSRLSKPRHLRSSLLTIRGNTEAQVATGTVTSSSYDVIGASAATWTPEAFRGLHVRVLSGAQAGEVRKILGNSSDELIVQNGFATNLAAGVTFEVFRPTSVLTFAAYDVIRADHRGYLGFDNVEFDIDGVLYVIGSIWNIGVTCPTGATIGDKYIICYDGGLYCDTQNGFSWRQVGAAPVGTLLIQGASGDLTVGGVPGYVLLCNCGGAGHSGGVILCGRMALDATSSDWVGAGGPSYTDDPRLWFDDFGLVSNGPVWMLGGRAEINLPLHIGGSGGLANRFCMRDKAFLEQQSDASAIPFAYIDIALGSELRIGGGAGGNGGWALVIVDGTDALPLAGFNSSGDYYMGQRGSFAGRD